MFCIKTELLTFLTIVKGGNIHVNINLRVSLKNVGLLIDDRIFKKKEILKTK